MSGLAQATLSVYVEEMYLNEDQEMNVYIKGTDVEFPDLTNSIINAGGDQYATTKGWVNSKFGNYSFDGDDIKNGTFPFVKFTGDDSFSISGYVNAPDIMGFKWDDSGGIDIYYDDETTETILYRFKIGNALLRRFNITDNQIDLNYGDLNTSASVAWDGTNTYLGFADTYGILQFKNSSNNGGTYNINATDVTISQVTGNTVKQRISLQQDNIKFNDLTTAQIDAADVNSAVTKEWVNAYKASLYATKKTEAGTSYTIQASDLGKNIHFTAATTITVTLPNGLATGFKCNLIKAAAGNVVITAATTLHSNGNSLKSLYTMAEVIHEGSNVWSAYGGKLTV